MKKGKSRNKRKKTRSMVDRTHEETLLLVSAALK